MLTIDDHPLLELRAFVTEFRLDTLKALNSGAQGRAAHPGITDIRTPNPNGVQQSAHCETPLGLDPRKSLMVLSGTLSQASECVQPDCARGLYGQ